jgi:hypothetical protein
MQRDRNILDVVRDLNIEFRHNPAFTVMLNKLDERAERRIPGRGFLFENIIT